MGKQKRGSRIQVFQVLVQIIYKWLLSSEEYQFFLVPQELSCTRFRFQTKKAKPSHNYRVWEIWCTADCRNNLQATKYLLKFISTQQQSHKTAGRVLPDAVQSLVFEHLDIYRFPTAPQTPVNLQNNNTRETRENPPTTASQQCYAWKQRRKTCFS